MNGSWTNWKISPSPSEKNLTGSFCENVLAVLEFTVTAFSSLVMIGNQVLIGKLEQVQKGLNEL